MPTAVELRAGSRFGAYRIEAAVGRGGMATVYRAEHVHLRRMVALKVPMPELAEDPLFRERFIRESRARRRSRIRTSSRSTTRARSTACSSSPCSSSKARISRTCSGAARSGLRARGDDRPDRPGARRRPRARPDPPRRQARQRAGGARALLSRRLRPHQAHRGDRGDDDRRRARHAQLRRAGADRGRRDRPPCRRLRARRHGLRVPRRRDAVRPSRRRRAALRAADRGAAARQRALSGPAGGGRRRPQPGAGQSAGRALRRLRRAGTGAHRCARRDGGSAAPAPVRNPLPQALERSRAQPLAGRGRLLDELAALLAQPRAIVCLAGEPGIGKTRLAAELAARAHADGAAVFYGRADEDPVIPYEAFAEALRPAPLIPGGDRFQLFEGVAHRFADAGRARPVALVLEDLQWADKETLSAPAPHRREPVAGPTRGDRHLPAAVGERRAPAARRAREPRPPPSGPPGHPRRARCQGVAALVGEGADPALVDALLERTNGNPLFIGELLREGGEDTTTALPESVRHVVRRRLERLSEPTQRVLAVAALLGGEFTPATLAAIVGDDAEDALEEARAAGLVTGDMLTHSLIRDVLISRLPGPERRRAHLEIAEVLERRGAEPAVLARHFQQARRPERGAPLRDRRRPRGGAGPRLRGRRRLPRAGARGRRRRRGPVARARRRPHARRPAALSRGVRRRGQARGG